MGATTEELRDAHDVLAEWYAENLVGLLDNMPVERAMLDLFAELTSAVGTEVADVGCGTGRLLPYLAGRGLSPRGVDLSPKMIEVAHREHPGFAYEVADLRRLPFEDASLAGDFDRYWLSAQEMENRFAAAGFAVVFQGSTPPLEAEPPYGYMLVRRIGSGTA